MNLGILVVAPQGQAAFRYAFTPADAAWLGRLLAAAAGSSYRGRLRGLVWRTLARFGAGRSRRLSLAAFIRQLEPSLPKTPWRQLPHAARQLAMAATGGVLRRRNPNAPVYVMPRDGSMGSAGGYGRPRHDGWTGQAELMEAESDAPAPPVATPPPAPMAAPPDAARPEDPAPPDADDGISADGGDGAGEPLPMADEPEPGPAAFDTQDGNRLVLNPRLLRRLLRAYRQRHGGGRWPSRGYPDGRPFAFGAPQWNPRVANYPYAGRRYGAHPRWQPAGAAAVRPWGARPRAGAPRAVRRALVGRLRRLAQGSRRVGTLRSVRSGRRYPVFGGRAGSRNYRIVARPRGRMQHEIMLVRGSELRQEMAS